MSNIEKYYYLIGYLREEPLNVLKGILVSDDTYTLALYTFMDRFYKPVLLAGSLVDTLITVPVTIK